jgi:hypothetical protein
VRTQAENRRFERRPLQRFTHARDFLRGEIVHHDDVARLKGAHQLLLDVSQDSAIHRAVNHQRRGQALRV